MHFYTEQALWILSTVTYIEIVFEEIFMLLVLTGEIVAAKNYHLTSLKMSTLYTLKNTPERNKKCV